MSRKEQSRSPGYHRIERESPHERRIESVPTAIPAFVGYTRRTEDGGGSSYINVPTLINSLSGFEERFGGAPDFRFSLESCKSDEADYELSGQFFKWVPSHKTRKKEYSNFYLYQSLQFYFANGGGQCYIVPVGSYESFTLEEGVLSLVPQKVLTTPSADDLIGGISALGADLSPSPTLILLPDAQLLDQEDCFRVQQEALLHCEVMADRIALFDIWGADREENGMESVEAFREGIGSGSLEFGVAYFPWVKTLLVKPESVSWYNMFNAASLLPELFPGQRALGELKQLAADLDAIKLYLRVPPPQSSDKGWINWGEMFHDNAARSEDPRSGPAWKVGVLLKMWDMLLDLAIEKKFPTGRVRINNDEITAYVFTLINPAGPLAYYLGQIFLYDQEFPEGAVGKMTAQVLAKYEIQPPASEGKVYPVVDTEDARTRMEEFLGMIFQIFFQAVESIVDNTQTLLAKKNEAFAGSHPYYRNLMQSLSEAANILPVTAGLAGILVENDALKGVWNAPTNVNMKKVAATCVPITNKEQEKLNRDPVGGKSVNAIRSFFGRGAATVYGARSLAGNHPDFRYLPDKRTLIYIERSIAQTLPTLAKLPSNEDTWGEIKRICKRFLKRIWRARGLQGDTKEEAYDIQVGLGETMTQADIDAGKLKLKIFVAPAVPTEFVVMEFEQEMEG